VIVLRRLLIPVMVLLLLAACGGAPRMPADHPEEAVPAEAVIAVTKAVRPTAAATEETSDTVAEPAASWTAEPSP
jgi:hypothetical protein